MKRLWLRQPSRMDSCLQQTIFVTLVESRGFNLTIGLHERLAEQIGPAEWKDVSREGAESRRRQNNGILPFAASRETVLVF